jgi:hypothetical protein
MYFMPYIHFEKYGKIWLYVGYVLAMDRCESKWKLLDKYES